MKALVLLIAIIICGNLFACGVKGDLYLPQDESTNNTQAKEDK